MLRAWSYPRGTKRNMSDTDTLSQLYVQKSRKTGSETCLHSTPNVVQVRTMLEGKTRCHTVHLKVTRKPSSMSSSTSHSECKRTLNFIKSGNEPDVRGWLIATSSVIQIINIMNSTQWRVKEMYKVVSTILKHGVLLPGNHKTRSTNKIQSSNMNLWEIDAYRLVLLGDKSLETRYEQGLKPIAAQQEGSYPSKLFVPPEKKVWPNDRWSPRRDSW